MPKTESRRIAPERRVLITLEHILSAERNNSRTCAIATALAAEGSLRPRVDMRCIAFTVNGERFQYMTPALAQKALLDFDAGKKIQPFILRLKDGIVKIAKRMGGPDRTQHARHAKGGRAARKGYTGPRAVWSKTRVNGFQMLTSK